MPTFEEAFNYAVKILTYFCYGSVILVPYLVARVQFNVLTSVDVFLMMSVLILALLAFLLNEYKFRRDQALKQQKND